MKYLFFIFLLFAVSCNSLADEKDIKKANAFVQTIENRIKSDEYSRLVLEEFSDYEGSPAKITFFFIKDSIMVAAKVSVGHEVWVNEFYYYFNEVGNIIKYLKKAIDNPYNPENEAIIFDGNGKTIWKNIDEMVVTVNRIKDLFSSIQKMRLDFARY